MKEVKIMLNEFKEEYKEIITYMKLFCSIGTIFNIILLFFYSNLFFNYGHTMPDKLYYSLLFFITSYFCVSIYNSLYYYLFFSKNKILKKIKIYPFLIMARGGSRSVEFLTFEFFINYHLTKSFGSEKNQMRIFVESTNFFEATQILKSTFIRLIISNIVHIFSIGTIYFSVIRIMPL